MEEGDKIEENMEKKIKEEDGHGHGHEDANMEKHALQEEDSAMDDDDDDDDACNDETDNFGDDEHSRKGSPHLVTPPALQRSTSTPEGTASGQRKKRRGSRSSRRNSMTTPSLDRRGSSLAESNASSTPSSSDTEEGGDNDAFSEELGPASPSRRRPGSSGGSSTAAAARRGKKSPPSAAELSQNFKLLEIERALTTEDSLGGLELLRELSVSKAGLVNDEMRRKVWPRLANVTGVDTDAELPTQEDCEQHPEYNQVVMDVNRSLKRFPPGIAEDDRPGLQDQLTRLIVRVLLRHPGLHYYQGYHDVAITFLLVVGEVYGYHIMQRLSISHLKEFMAPTMDRTTYLLNYMYPLIQNRSPDLHAFLESSELGTIFALPWMITWYAHVLPDYEDVVRLYDFFLSKPPLMPVYFAVSLVLHRTNDILACECDMAMVHHLLSRIPDELPFERLLSDCQKLYLDYPPSTLEKRVEERYAKIEADMRRQRRPKKPSGEGSIGALGIGVTVLAGAALVAGVIVYRWMHNSAAQV